MGDPSVDALHYDLDLAWDPTSATLTGEATRAAAPPADGDTLRLDLAPSLEVAAVALDGAPVDSEHDGKDLRHRAPVVADERDVLRGLLRRHARADPAPTTRSDFSTTGWTVTADGKVWTMQEPYGAFTWYPVNDQPSDKALYDIAVTAPGA